MSQPQGPPPPPEGPPPTFHYQPPFWAYTRAPDSPQQSLAHRQAAFVVSVALQLSLFVPGVIVILIIWWSATQRVCPPSASAGDKCFWLLWLSLPVATASFLWGIADTISNRRRVHSRSGIPKGVNRTVKGILALGATTCFILLVWHVVEYDIWSVSCEATMAALLALLMIVNWIIFGWAIYTGLS